MNKNLNRIAILATFLGLLNVLGLVTHIPFFYKLGEALSFCPRPGPYTRLNVTDPADEVRGLFVGCQDKSGETIWTRWDHIFRSAIPGPHRRTVFFLSYFGALFRLNDDRTKNSFEYKTRYYFCNSGPLAEVVGCSASTPDVVFKSVWGKDPKETIHTRVECIL